MKNNTNNKQTFNEWSKSLELMDFDHYSLEMKNTILNGNMPEDEKKLFETCFDYVYKLNKEKKPLDIKLLKIHLEQVKDFQNVKMQDFIRVIILLGYCGFNITTL